MTHAELHMKVRALVAGRGFAFVVSTSSIEQHPGRLEVEWSVCVLIDGAPKATGRSLNPEQAFEQARAVLDAVRPLVPPPALVAIGAPPAPEGQSS